MLREDFLAPLGLSVDALSVAFGLPSHNDAANRNLARVVVVPLTSNVGSHYPGEALVDVDGRPGKAMADQIMAADKTRLKSRLGGLSKPDMRAVEDAVLVHLGMPK